MTIIEEPFVIAVPLVGFDREGIGSVDGSLVMSVDLPILLVIERFNI